MTRAELERLDRDALIARAEEAGVTRARVLTRPELVDELLLRTTVDPVTKKKARGFFGVARDLVARVIERGLNLPDAADRLRTIGGAPLSSRPSAPAALPTVTLAEIYAAQGHRERAVDTLEGVLATEPDHSIARSLLTQLLDATFQVPIPRMPPEDEELLRAAALEDDEDESPKPPAEPMQMLDDTPLPPRYDVDECVAIHVDPNTLYVYWEVRESTLVHVQSVEPEGKLTLRFLIVVPTWDGPLSSTVDYDVGALVGDFFARDLKPGAVVRSAIGWKRGGVFIPIAHSPALETPPSEPSALVADALVRWTPQGAFPVRPTDPDAASIGRALGLLRREEALVRLAAQGGAVFLGSSERFLAPPT